MSETSKTSEFYFESERFKLNAGARIIADSIATIFKIVGLATGVFALITPAPAVQWIGALICLFATERFLHRDEPVEDASRVVLTEERRMNIARFFSPRTEKLLVESCDRAVFFSGSVFLHLLERLIERGDVLDVLALLDVNEKQFSEALAERLKKNKKQYARHADVFAELEPLFSEAFIESRKAHRRAVAPLDLFAALDLIPDVDMLSLFETFGIGHDDIARAAALRDVRRSALRGRMFRRFGGRVRIKHKIMNRAWTARPTPALDSMSIDLTDRARTLGGGFFTGHTEAYERLVDILSYPDAPNVILVGEAGVGKHSTVEHLATMIVDDLVPPQLFDKRVVELDANRLLAGADKGAVHARIQEVFDEIVAAGNIILYIPNIHELFHTGSASSVSIADALVPFLSSNTFPVVGTATPRDHRMYIEPSASLAEIFHTVRAEEMTEDDAARVLVYKSASLEMEYRVGVSYAAIKKAVELGKKYFHKNPLPASAEDLLREAVVAAAHQKVALVNARDVVAVAERRVNIPLHEAEQEERRALLQLEEIVHGVIVGQAHAVTAVADALRLYRSGLARRGGPIASFLFAGPTGVGKTELSKVLARVQFGSEEAIIRLDMSEFQEPKSIERLIGSEDGSLVGLLSERVVERPYSLILLDEFEKAHRSIQNIFLQVLDDGRLTDGIGRVVDLKNTVIIATSNARSEWIKEEIDKGTDPALIEDGLKRKLTEVFSPELVNRFSRIILFKPLTFDEIRMIARRKLDELAGVVKETNNVELSYDEGSVSLLAEKGYEPAFGARPLRTAVADLINGKLAKEILAGNVRHGDRIMLSAGETDGEKDFILTIEHA